MIEKELLDILVCPKCKGDLDYKPTEDGKDGELVCHACKLRYMVVDEIPNLIIEDAKSLDETGAGQ